MKPFRQTVFGDMVDLLCEDQIDDVAMVLAKAFWPKIAEELTEMVEKCLRKKKAPCIDPETADELNPCFSDEFQECLKKAIWQFAKENGIAEFIEIGKIRYWCPDSEPDMWKNANEIVRLFV